MNRVLRQLTRTSLPVITTNPFALSRLFLTGLAFLGFLLGRSASAQTLFVADSSNGSITKVAPDGSPTPFVSGGFYEPLGVAFDTAGNLFVADFTGNTIKKITPAGVTSVFATTGLSNPAGLAFDASGNLFVANYGSNTVEIFNSAGAGFVFASDGLSEPTSLAFDAAGNLYVANASSNLITKYTSVGAVSAFAAAGLNSPAGLAFDAAGNLYAANAADNTIVMYTPNGTPSYFASSGLDQPSEMAFDAAGNLYVANFGSNAIVKITPGGVTTPFATTGLSGPTGLALAPIPSFFDGEAYLGDGAYYLRFANGNYFGYYSFLSDFRYIYHYDLGYEFVFDAADGKSGVYLSLRFRQQNVFLHLAHLPVPVPVRFQLENRAVLLPEPERGRALQYERQTCRRYFYDFATGKVITK